MISVVEINEITQLDEFRQPWQTLLAKTANASFFQSLDWLQAYWRNYGAGQKLRALIIKQDGQTIAIVPLVVRREATRLGTLRFLTYPLHDWGTFYGPIGPNPSAALTVAFRHIQQTPRDWDVVEPRYVDSAGADGGRTASAMRAVEMNPRRKAWMPASVVDLSAGWDAYWASRKTHFRTNVRSCEKKLKAKHSVEYVRYRPAGAACLPLEKGDRHVANNTIAQELGGVATSQSPFSNPRWDLYNDCEEVSRRSWQHTSATGTTLSTDSIRPFLHDCHAAAVECGASDVNLLYIDDQPAAYAYNYHFQGHVSGLRMGFDPELGRQGAGTLLQYYMLQDSCRHGDTFFDQGAGSLDCKRNWRSRVATSYAFSHFALDSTRAQLLRCKRAFDGWRGKADVAVDLDAVAV